MAWQGLHVPQYILSAIEQQGFKEPTPIQKAVLPSAIKKKCDVIGAAETGSGKTLAYGVPLLARVIEAKKHEVRSSTKVKKSEKSVELQSDQSEDDDAMSMSNPEQEDEECDLTPDEEESEFYWETDQVQPDLSLLIEKVEPDGTIVPDAKDTRHPSGLKGLVLCPTRELAVQVADHLRLLASHTDVSIAVIFGGLSVEKQERQLQEEPDIVVATPGRLWHFLELGQKHLCGVPFLHVLVVDEADRLLEKGHFEELHRVLQFMRMDATDKAQIKAAPKRQTLVFSATLTFQPPTPNRIIFKKKKKKQSGADSRIRQLSELLDIRTQDALVVDLTPASSKVSTLRECKLLCPEVDEKDVHLVAYLRHHAVDAKCLIFCNSKEGVRRLRNVLTLLHFHPQVVHSTMHQKQRLKNSEKFRKQKAGILLASDIAARGWDVPEVEHVIHYDVPATSETFVHRSGRTARAQREGAAVLLLLPKEVKQLRRILFNLKRNEAEIPVLSLKGSQLEECRRAVRLAKQIVQAEMKVEKKRGDMDWVAKTVREADLALDSDMEEELSAFNTQKKTVERQQKHLKEQLEAALQAWNAKK